MYTAIALFVLALVFASVFFVYGMPADGTPRINPFTMFLLGAMSGSFFTSGFAQLRATRPKRAD